MRQNKPNLNETTYSNAVDTLTAKLWKSFDESNTSELYKCLAAPEMYEALEDILDVLCSMEADGHKVSMQIIPIQKALAKARGEK